MKKSAVLIIDDDPSHLRIYGWIIQATGYQPLPALVTQADVELPDSAAVDLVLLDYHLNGCMTAPEVAKLRTKYAEAPILVLSDAVMMPDDIGLLVDGFIRKGDPARLVETVTQTLTEMVQ